MATHQAIGAVPAAVVRLLEQSWSSAVLDGLDPLFLVYQASDFATPMESGISVFVHRVSVDQVQRTLPASASGHRTPLPVAVNLLLTAWGRQASVAHDLLGWAMRAIADNPILAPSALNEVARGTFGEQESVALTPLDLTHDELIRLWQVLPNDLQLSVCYLGRTIHIEAGAPHPLGPLP